MLNYANTLAQLTEQLGFPEDALAALGDLVGGLRPAQKAIVCVGAATVACMLVGLTVKSLKKRDNGSGKGKGCSPKRMPIDILGGSQDADMEQEDTWPPQDLLQVDQGFGEMDDIAYMLD